MKRGTATARRLSSPRCHSKTISTREFASRRAINRVQTAEQHGDNKTYSDQARTLYRRRQSHAMIAAFLHDEQARRFSHCHCRLFALASASTLEHVRRATGRQEQSSAYNVAGSVHPQHVVAIAGTVRRTSIATLKNFQTQRGDAVPRTVASRPGRFPRIRTPLPSASSTPRG